MTHQEARDQLVVIHKAVKEAKEGLYRLVPEHTGYPERAVSKLGEGHYAAIRYRRAIACLRLF